MSKMGEYTGRVLNSNWFIDAVFGTLIALVAATGGLEIYSTRRASNPNPPIYRDVNGDGVEDKIVQRKVEKPGLFWWIGYNTLEDEVLFGIEVNGKKLYLPKDQFEEYKK